MISIIIASANPQLLLQIKLNIEETVGVPYEIIAFENSSGAKGMCEMYNEGIDKAKYDILCFMHEDLALKNIGWGEAVQKLFSRHPKLGVLGIAGSTYKSIVPGGWGSPGSKGAERSNLIQSFKYMKKDSLRPYVNPNDESWSRVVVVDGAWICVKREVVNKYRFDSETFKGFHCYDIDFCLSAGKEYDIAVTYEVLINHFSEGKLDKAWMQETFKLFYKWENDLPRSLTELSDKQIRKTEKINFRFWLKQLRLLDFDSKIAYKVLHRPKVKKVLGLKYFLKFHYTIFAIFHSKKKEIHPQNFFS